MTDTEIIDLFFERSEQAIDELAKKHGNAVARVARNILGNEQDTEECVNDTYLGTWNAIPPHRPSPLRTFVCKIARNLATMKYHSNTAEKRNSQYDLALDELEDALADKSSVEEAYEVKELAEAINGFLATLNYTDRFIFTRRYWYSDPVRDIAKMAHSTTNSVTVRLFRIREKLRLYLVKEGLLV
ncbi:MAG: sigma-70 family RNA polymerase sigma factor [Oscillospiraceae bacterium]|nr:sigma-70 family RNA polymerase sigma factor [Oscillospiraceae bacterium]